MTDAVWCIPTNGASRHLVPLIRSPIMMDAVWCILTRGIIYPVQSPIMTIAIWYIPTRGITYSVQSPIMADAVWYIPTRGITYSISHHDGCCLVHPDTWYQLNAIRHQDGCRFVHPAKWDISSIPCAIMTDADWCIPPSGTLDNFGVPS